MKKGQAWGFDLAIATSIFLAGVVFFYFFVINSSNERDNFDILKEEGNLFMSDLLSIGEPANWNETNVRRIGILSEDKINSTKFERFYNLANNNYPLTKRLFKINNNYFVNFSTGINLSNGTAIYGVGLKSENPNNLVSVTRVNSFNGKIVTIKVEIWN